MIPTLTLCSLDRLHGMVDVYNYIIRVHVVNILTSIYFYLKREVERNPQYLGYLFPTFSKMVRFAPYKKIRIVFTLNNNNNNRLALTK